MANYHTSNSCECMGVNGQPLQLHTGHIFYYKSHKNPYQVLSCTLDLNMQ